MTFAVLSPEEVRAKYANANNKEYMLGVLADLTVSSRAEMKTFLGDAYEKPVRKPKVSLDKELARKYYEQGKTDRQIAELLNVTKYTVSCWRRQSGLAGYVPVQNEDERMRLYEAGATDLEIAKAIGISQSGVFDWRTRRGLPSNGGMGGDRRSKKFRKEKEKENERPADV